MNSYSIKKLFQYIGTQPVLFEYSVKVLVKIKLTKYSPLVKYQKLPLFIGQNSYAAFIIIKINKQMKLLLKGKT